MCVTTFFNTTRTYYVRTYVRTYIRNDINIGPINVHWSIRYDSDTTPFRDVAFGEVINL